jgi:iron(III) transport system substrate-binding protein
MIRLFYLLLFLVGFQSCVVDTGTSSSIQKVIVYTDCDINMKADYIQSFKVDNGIELVLHKMHADTIISRLRREGHNTNCDLVLLRSAYDMNKLSKYNLLNRVNSWKLEELIPKYLKSEHETWYGVGFDPYVLISRSDSLHIVYNYQELLSVRQKNYWSTDLQTHENSVPFLAYFLKNKSVQERIYRYERFLDYQYYVTDSIQHELGSEGNLTFYSEYLKDLSNRDSISDRMIVVFPNQQAEGVYYNTITAGVVKQAKNYTNAKILLEYFASASVNENLNGDLNTFPVNHLRRRHPFIYQNNNFKHAQKNLDYLMGSYSNVGRIISKLKATISIDVEPRKRILPSDTLEVNKKGKP